MKTLALIKYAFLTLFSVLLLQCSSDTTSPEEGGAFRLLLTDAVSDYDAVDITFSEVSVHYNSEWITVVGDEVTVNLLDYSNGETYILASEDMSAGKYTQIRLHITSASITVDGEQKEMTVPSEKLKLGPQFTIQDGITYEMVIDFNAEQSVVVSGPEDNPTYKLKPHIRVVPKALTGSISGIVLNTENNPVAYAKQADAVVTSSIVKDDGSFILAFLEEGEYQVEVEDETGKIYTNPSVSVIVGNDIDLGEITLE